MAKASPSGLDPIQQQQLDAAAADRADIQPGSSDSQQLKADPPEILTAKINECIRVLSIIGGGSMRSHPELAEGLSFITFR